MGFYSKLIEISLGLKTESYLFVAQTKTSYASKFYRVPEEIIRNAIETKILPLLELANSLHVAWEETKDENIWKVRVPTDNVIDSEFYHLMDSTIQTKIEDLN